MQSPSPGQGCDPGRQSGCLRRLYTQKAGKKQGRKGKIYAAECKVLENSKERWKVKVAQSCPILYDPLDYTVHGILQARILEWVAIPFSRGSSQPSHWTQVSPTAGQFITSWATKEAQREIGHFNEQCKEIEENNRMGKTKELFKKIADIKRTFHARMGMIKKRNSIL